jgi:hypothetical protein
MQADGGAAVTIDLKQVMSARTRFQAPTFVHDATKKSSRREACGGLQNEISIGDASECMKGQEDIMYMQRRGDGKKGT